MHTKVVSLLLDHLGPDPGMLDAGNDSFPKIFFPKDFTSIIFVGVSKIPAVRAREACVRNMAASAHAATHLTCSH